MELDSFYLKLRISPFSTIQLHDLVKEVTEKLSLLQNCMSLTDIWGMLFKFSERGKLKYTRHKSRYQAFEPWNLIFLAWNLKRQLISL